MSDETVQYPWGSADVQAIEFAAEMSAEVKNTETILQIEEMDDNAEINLSVSERVGAGANLLIEVSADATVGGQDLTFGDGFEAAAYTVAASKSAALAFKHNGTAFVMVGAALKN